MKADEAQGLAQKFRDEQAAAAKKVADKERARQEKARLRDEKKTRKKFQRDEKFGERVFQKGIKMVEKNIFSNSRRGRFNTEFTCMIRLNVLLDYIQRFCLLQVPIVFVFLHKLSRSRFVTMRLVLHVVV